MCHQFAGASPELHAGTLSSLKLAEVHGGLYPCTLQGPCIGQPGVEEHTDVVLKEP